MAVDFVHRTVPGVGTPLLLLHGTGGDETQLLDLGRTLSASAPLLSPRGRVMDHGLHRFFRRLGERRFDEEDLRVRAAELAQWVRKTAPVPPIAVGYSNGANIAAALLLLHPGTLRGAMLFRPTVPPVPDHRPDLHGTDVLLVPAEDDPLTPLKHVTGLAGALRQAGASVTVTWQQDGHGLTPDDIATARAWLHDRLGPGPALRTPGYPMDPESS